jgi:hypothetical protein
MSKILRKGESGFGILVEHDAGYISHDLNKEYLSENFQFKENEPILITCILQKWGVKNKNGRIYPKEILVPQVEEYQNKVQANSAVGETDHPENSTISLANLSHMITKMWWGKGDDENVLYGEIKLLVTPGFIKLGIVSMPGDKILFYIQNKIKIGISSRGVGTLKEMQGENYVQNDFELIGFDLVESPSTPGGYLFPKHDSKKVSIDSTTLAESENKLLKAMNKFLEWKNIL